MFVLLYESPMGIKFIREDQKRRSTVKVKNGEYTLHTYRMNNVPFFEHPYLSWANLDCCGGWIYDAKYLYSAVQKRKKLVSDFDIMIDSANIEDSKNLVQTELNKLAFGDDVDIYLRNPNQWMQKIRWPVIAARKGALRDFFEIDTILSVYEIQGLKISRPELSDYFEVPLITLYKGEFRGFDFANVSTNVECVTNGLALGYPIESTASIIRSFS